MLFGELALESEVEGSGLRRGRREVPCDHRIL